MRRGSITNDLLDGKSPNASKAAVAAIANGGLSLAAGLGGSRGVFVERMSMANPLTPQGVGSHIIKATQEVGGGGSVLQGAVSTAGRVADLFKEAGLSAAQKKDEEHLE